MAKRSLHIGINDYPGTGQDLSGCVNDARDWAAELGRRGFQTNMLLDAEATKAKMVQALKDQIASAGRDDIFTITYSGHGSWVPDKDGDEEDGRDEALCPYDSASGNLLIDDEIHEIMSERARGARIIFISDSCHSGSVARFAGWPTDDKPTQAPTVRFLAPEIHLPAEARAHALRVQNLRSRCRIRAAALLLSGCSDHEFSYDAWFGNRANGAFTHAALRTLKALPAGATYKDWFKAVRAHLPSVVYPQTPQISGSYAQRKWAVLTE